MERVTQGLEVGLSSDSCCVEIVYRGVHPKPTRASSIVLLPRHARYLANLLVEYASEAEEMSTEKGSSSSSR